MTIPSQTENEIHVWHAVLDEAESIDELRRLLSDEERSRAERFRFDRDRQRFLAAHGILRTIVGQYLDIPSVDLQFQEGPHGKPAVRESMNDLQLMFNMSKSNGHSLYAVTRQSEVGVDIEEVRDVPEMDEIVKRFFSTAEQVEFASLRPGEKTRGFFNCWTRKEAVLKAVGSGLRTPLDSFDVSLAPGGPACILKTGPGMGKPIDWSLVHIEPASGFVGALAVRKQNASMLLREWIESRRQQPGTPRPDRAGRFSCVRQAAAPHTPGRVRMPVAGC